MTYDDDTPHTPKIIPSHLPDDLTAKSLSACSGKALGDNHPAANLEAMRDALLPVLVSEGDGEKLLRRQAQVLDSLFHALIHDGLLPQNPDAPPNTVLLALALRAQKQAEETLGRAHMMPYHKVMEHHIANKPSETLADLLIKRERKMFQGGPLNFDEQTEEP